MMIDRETRTVYVTRKEYLQMQERVQLAEIEGREMTEAALNRPLGELLHRYGSGNLIVKVCEPKQETRVAAGWRP